MYVANACHTRQLHAVVCHHHRLPPSDSSGAPCTLLLRAASDRPGLPRSKSGPYRRTSHDTPWSLFVGHPGVEKLTLIKSNHCDTKPTAGQIVRHVTDRRAPKLKNRLSQLEKKKSPLQACTCAYKNSTARIQGGGCVSIARANKEEHTENAVGGGGQNSQLGGLAEDGIPAVSRRGRTLTPHVRNIDTTWYLVLL